MGRTEIDSAFVAHAKHQLFALLDNDQLVADWFARYMTAPKYPDLLDASGELRQAQVQGREYLNGEPVDEGWGKP
jgi:hypothetical protein